jgi:leucyl-tRNA synthetase
MDWRLRIPNIFSPLTPEGGTKAAEVLTEDKAFSEKSGFVLKSSGFLNGLGYKEATKKVIEALENIGQGQGKTNYRLRDAVFSRQRYWGEPFPVYYVNGMPQMIDTKYLPIRLPEVEKYLPTETGEPPLGNAAVWAWDTIKGEVVSNDLIDHKNVFPLELNTMPGWAGSSWYFNRYMDPHNDNAFASQEALNYWKDVDLYIGGSEHATGHLLYSRFWQKFLFDKGLVPVDEYAKKLINQGMILGMSAFVYRVAYINRNSNVDNSEALKKIPVFLLSETILKKYNQVKNGLLSTIEINDKLKLILSENYNISDEVLNDTVPFISELHVDLSCINDITNELDIEKFKAHPLYADYKDAEFILEDGKYIVGREVEKMSKSKYNVVNPDQICAQYGADSLRLYEMFLGPLEQYKPWNTAGITGVHGFLKKLWRLYHQGENETFYVSDSPPSEGLGEALKTLHKTIKKVQEDIENFSFNTSVSTFMIAVNELTDQKCTSKAVLEQLLILLSPYAPHIAEELWEKLGHTESISTAPFPKFDASHLVESSKNYPISFNGKMKFTMELPMDFTVQQIEEAVLAHQKTQEQLQGSTPKKVIIVPGKIVNIVG